MTPRGIRLPPCDDYRELHGVCVLCYGPHAFAPFSGNCDPTENRRRALESLVTRAHHDCGGRGRDWAAAAPVRILLAAAISSVRRQRVLPGADAWRARR